MTKVYHDGAVSGARRAIDAALSVFLALLCIVWLYPVLLILLNSFKTELAISTSTVFALPTAETFVGFDNYVYGITQMNFLSSFGYSLVITVTSVLLILLCLLLTGCSAEASGGQLISAAEAPEHTVRRCSPSSPDMRSALFRFRIWRTSCSSPGLIWARRSVASGGIQFILISLCFSAITFFLKSLNYAIPDISLLMEVYILQTPAVLLLHPLML